MLLLLFMLFALFMIGRSRSTKIKLTMDQQHPYLHPQDFQYNQQAQWQQQNQQPMSDLQHPQPQQGQGPPPIVSSGIARQPSQQAQFSTPVNPGGAAGQYFNLPQQHPSHTASPIAHQPMQGGPFGAQPPQQMPYGLPHASSSHPGGLDSHPVQPAPPQSVPPVLQQPIHVDPRSASAAPGWLDVPAWALGNRTPVNNASPFTSNAQAARVSPQQIEALHMHEAERRERINALEQENSQRELDIVIEASKYGMEPFEVKSEQELEQEIAATHRDWLEIRKKQLQEEHEQRMQELAARSNIGSYNGQGGGSHKGAGPASQWSKHSSSASASHRASSKHSHKSVAPPSASRVPRTPSVERGLPKPAEGNLADQGDVDIIHEKVPATRAVDIERSNSPRQSRSHSRRHTRQREAVSTSRTEAAGESRTSRRRDGGGRYRSAGVEVYYASVENTDGYVDPGKIRSKRWSFSKR